MNTVVNAAIVILLVWAGLAALAWGAYLHDKHRDWSDE